MEQLLIDKEELEKRFPALASKPYRLQWLVRSRQIPVVKIGRRIYFRPEEIINWLGKHSIPAQTEISDRGDNKNEL
jgi:hypothetical protein